MVRFTLHVPEQYNDGSPVGQEALQEIERRILRIAGGFTLTHGIGAWQDEDTGQVYREPMRLYLIDADEDKRAAIHELADVIVLALQQVAAYVTEQDVRPQLVTAAVPS